MSAAIVPEVELEKTQDQPLRENDGPPHEVANRICLSAGGKKTTTKTATLPTLCVHLGPTHKGRADNKQKFIHTLFYNSTPPPLCSFPRSLFVFYARVERALSTSVEVTSVDKALGHQSGQNDRGLSQWPTGLFHFFGPLSLV